MTTKKQRDKILETGIIPSGKSLYLTQIFQGAPDFYMWYYFPSQTKTKKKHFHQENI